MASANSEDVEAYTHVVLSFKLGMLRFWSADAAHSRLNAALLSYKLSASRNTLPETDHDVFRHLAKIPYQSYDALTYVTDLSLLVYATTLLDTFLSDTTTFLLLKYPHSIGKTQQISIENLIGASSPRQLLVEAASRKTREISFLSFVGRIEFLQGTFGLTLNLDETVKTALVHYPSVRNAAVHDQGVFELSLSDEGKVVSRQKTCLHRPSLISAKDINAAVNAYRSVANAIASSVMGHCLKAPQHSVLEGLIPKELSVIDEQGGG
jgi:hypothetical protein